MLSLWRVMDLSYTFQTLKKIAIFPWKSVLIRDLLVASLQKHLLKFVKERWIGFFTNFFQVSFRNFLWYSQRVSHEIILSVFFLMMISDETSWTLPGFTYHSLKQVPSCVPPEIPSGFLKKFLQKVLLRLSQVFPYGFFPMFFLGFPTVFFWDCIRSSFWKPLRAFTIDFRYSSSLFFLNLFRNTYRGSSRTPSKISALIPAEMSSGISPFLPSGILPRIPSGIPKGTPSEIPHLPPSGFLQ